MQKNKQNIFTEKVLIHLKLSKYEDFAISNGPEIAFVCKKMWKGRKNQINLLPVQKDDIRFIKFC